ncbi:MAG: hypothetical protein WDM71_04915 [Ferruginibacter sp.]
MKKFKSVNNIKLKSENELSELIGKARAKIIIDYFSKENPLSTMKEG